MMKKLMAAAPGIEQQEAEAKFKSYILEYKQRAAAHALQVEKEVFLFDFLLVFIIFFHFFFKKQSNLMKFQN